MRFESSGIAYNVEGLINWIKKAVRIGSMIFGVSDGFSNRAVACARIGRSLLRQPPPPANMKDTITVAGAEPTCCSLSRALKTKP